MKCMSSPESWNRDRQRGVFIVFEGISGSGKSEGISSLLRYAADLDPQPVVTEWNSNRFIRWIVTRLDQKRWLSPNLYSLLQWISFVIDYWRIIMPALWKGRTVIADRYMYTGLCRDEVNGSIQWLGEWVAGWVRKPDKVVYFHTSPVICFTRIQKRGKTLFYPKRKSSDAAKDDLTYLQNMHTAYMSTFSRYISKETELQIAENGESYYMHQLAAYMLTHSERRSQTTITLPSNPKEKAREM
ncbi:deoxynucleoside kinase [Paenibacillus hexagrammi]|uniref:Deoxynucleoside kinase n=1 Tax=Paenibacillus hexagrammi TaxID=2908839 RepID=A0ABY3SCY9_9BACL|nr:deoxynucleoside kinase [Paenibacillus sp. YPD9-1]UJF31350.1 deoxynucleoside kinase [Paenibacillus sp. YPD9-1]